MFFNKNKNKNIFSINYDNNGNISIDVSHKLSEKQHTEIAAFLYLLIQNSIFYDQITKCLSENTKPKNSAILISKLLNEFYAKDYEQPIISPLMAFKKNVKS